jgi:hypothetical protein
MLARPRADEPDPVRVPETVGGRGRERLGEDGLELLGLGPDLSFERRGVGQGDLRVGRASLDDAVTARERYSLRRTATTLPRIRPSGSMSNGSIPGFSGTSTTLPRRRRRRLTVASSSAGPGSSTATTSPSSAVS